MERYNFFRNHRGETSALGHRKISARIRPRTTLYKWVRVVYALLLLGCTYMRVLWIALAGKGSQNILVVFGNAVPRTIEAAQKDTDGAGDFGAIAQSRQRRGIHGFGRQARFKDVTGTHGERETAHGRLHGGSHQDALRLLDGTSLEHASDLDHVLIAPVGHHENGIVGIGYRWWRSDIAHHRAAEKEVFVGRVHGLVEAHSHATARQRGTGPENRQHHSQPKDSPGRRSRRHDSLVVLALWLGCELAPKSRSCNGMAKSSKSYFEFTTRGCDLLSGRL
jgi:hypothetical protein